MYIAYLKDKNDEIIWQIFDLNNLEVDVLINNISKCSFSIFHNNPYAKKNYLKEFQKVVIKKQSQNTEKVVFSGYITKVSAYLQKVEIEISSEEIRLAKLFTNYDYNLSRSIKDSLVEVISEINLRHWTSFVLDSDVLDAIDFNFFRGESLFSLLKRLSWINYRFTLSWDTVIFKHILWSDRSFWTDFFEYSYSVDRPDFRNIDYIEVVYDFENYWNKFSLFHKDWVSEISESWDYVLENSLMQHFWNSSLGETMFELYKNPEIWYRILPLTSDYFEVEIWDLVSVYVNVWSDLLKINSVLEVVWKKISKTWKIEFLISATPPKDNNLRDKLNYLENQVKILWA